MSGSGSTETESATPSTADVSQAIVGLGIKLDTDQVLDPTDDRAEVFATAAVAASVAALATYAIAGDDNTTSHDYTATGVKTTSTVFGAVSFKTDGSAVAAVAGTITPGANKITVAGGDNLATNYNLVFLVVK